MYIYIYTYIHRERERDHIYIYIYICIDAHMYDAGICEQKHSSREEGPWIIKLSEHQVGGRRAVSAAGLQGEGCHERSACFTDTGDSYTGRRRRSAAAFRAKNLV